MGFNTVAFLLNDMMYDLERSPKAVVWGLTHPPMSNNQREQDIWFQSVQQVALENGEPGFSRQALEVLGTFHADYTSFFRAGGNCIDELKLVRYGTITDKKTGQKKDTVVLEMPEWWSKRYGVLK